MSADNSSGLDEPAERMTLLGQREQDTNPTAVDATVVLTRHGEFISKRLEDLISQCQTDGEIDRELWDDLEIHRRSADTYIDQYLDSLQQIHEERGNIYEIEDTHNETYPTDVAVRNPDPGAPTMTRAEWRLKISHDSLSRDLLAMCETLDFLKTRPGPTASGWSCAIAALAASASMIVIMWAHYDTMKTLGVLAVPAVSIAVYHSLGMWKWARTESIERYEGKVKALFRRLNNNELDEEDRASLSGMWSWMVERFRK